MFVLSAPTLKDLLDMDAEALGHFFELVKFVLMLGVPWLIKITSETRANLRDLNSKVVSLETWRAEAAQRFSEMRQDIHELRYEPRKHPLD